MFYEAFIEVVAGKRAVMNAPRTADEASLEQLIE